MTLYIHYILHSCLSIAIQHYHTKDSAKACNSYVSHSHTSLTHRLRSILRLEDASIKASVRSSFGAGRFSGSFSKHCRRNPRIPSVHWIPSASELSSGAAIVTMYVNNSNGARAGSPSPGNGNLFCATSIMVKPSDHTSEVTVYSRPCILSG